MKQLPTTPYISVEMYCGEARVKPVLNANMVRVLKEIDSVGSINGAVKNLHMGYSNTLHIIASVENALGCTIVERVRPYGSRLTEEGKCLIAMFEKIEKDIQQRALDIMAADECFVIQDSLFAPEADE